MHVLICPSAPLTGWLCQVTPYDPWGLTALMDQLGFPSAYLGDWWAAVQALLLLVLPLLALTSCLSCSGHTSSLPTRWLLTLPKTPPY